MTATHRLLKLMLGALAAGVIAGCGGSGTTAPPVIVVGPGPATVVDGGTATFTVSTTGDAPLSYRWQRGGADLVDGAAVSGATGAALSLVARYGDNASQITVAVSNAAGNVMSGPAMLTVTPMAPVITAQPSNATAAIGAPVSFTVGLSGGTAPVSFQWRRDGVAIAGATAASYGLAAVAAGDNAAQFAVDVINPAGTLTSAIATLGVASVGRSWGPSVLVSSGDPLHTPGYPQVGIDAAGNAIAVWQEALGLGVRNAVWASRHVAGGGWTAAATIDDTVGNGVEPQLAMSPAGAAVATFVQTTSNGGGNTRMLSNRFDGTRWATPGRINLLDAAIDFEHRVAIAPTGEATVAFNQAGDPAGRRAKVAGSNAAGAWGVPNALGAPRSYAPQVAVASATGDAVMVWFVAATPSTGALWASGHHGAGWSVPVSLMSSGQDMTNLRVRADAAGNAVAVWQERLGARTTVRAMRLDVASGVWSAPFSVNDGTRHAFEPELAMGDSGDAVVVWYEASDAGQAAGLIDIGVVASRFDAGSASWRAAVRVQPAGSSAGVLPKVALDRAGNAIALWLQAVPGYVDRQEVWTSSVERDAALWATPVKLMTDPAAYALRGTSDAPQIAVNASGEAVAVWFQRTDAPSALGIWARVWR